MKLKRITKFSKFILRDVSSLNAQLSSSGKGIEAIHLKSALKDRNVYLLGLHDGERVIGMVTVTVIRAISGSKGYIDDVVVDGAYRGNGLGRTLMSGALSLAKKLRLHKVEFTSKRSRIAANALYQKMGFELKDSNAYVMKLS